MADKDTPATTAAEAQPAEPEKLDGRTREGRAAAAAQLEHERNEDERRTRLSETELVNYERALGAPIVKGE